MAGQAGAALAVHAGARKGGGGQQGRQRQQQGERCGSSHVGERLGVPAPEGMGGGGHEPCTQHRPVLQNQECMHAV